MYIYTYIYIYIICLYICIHTYIYICVSVHACECGCGRGDVRGYVCMPMCMRIRMRVHGCMCYIMRRSSAIFNERICVCMNHFSSTRSRAIDQEQVWMSVFLPYTYTCEKDSGRRRASKSERDGACVHVQIQIHMHMYKLYTHMVYTSCACINTHVWIQVQKHTDIYTRRYMKIKTVREERLHAVTCSCV